MCSFQVSPGLPAAKSQFLHSIFKLGNAGFLDLTYPFRLSFLEKTTRKIRYSFKWTVLEKVSRLSSNPPRSPKVSGPSGGNADMSIDNPLTSYFWHNKASGAHRGQSYRAPGAEGMLMRPQWQLMCLHLPTHSSPHQRASLRTVRPSALWAITGLK